MLKSRSMSVVCAAILFSVAASCSSDVIATAPTTQGFPETNIKTLNLLKEELRKNNDDYKDKAIIDSSKAGVKAGGRRALFGKPPAPERGTSREPAATAAAHVTKQPVNGDREKIDKLRNFLDKYKVIVSEFMANRTESRQQPAAAGGEGPVLRAGRGKHETLPEGLDHRPPSGAQLDMSPARGAKVHGLRNKHRLCHRHVMIPEGPKYDSKGKVYLAEHGERGWEYAHTRAPRLLLPKCCNCCRKSVLGCE